MKSLLAITILISSFLQVSAGLCSHAADPTKPHVGEPLPDFRLTRVSNYPKTQASLKDFHGKWLILDFWFTGCTSAIRSLPMINKLHLKFRNRIQIMMVGLNSHRYRDIENVYDVLKGKYDLQLASAYDSVLHVQWDIWAMPYLIIVDPQGIVRHITTGTDMDEEKLQRLLDGRPVKFRSDPVPVSDFDVAEFPGTRDTSLVYRSILTKWKGQRSSGSHLASYNEWTDYQLQNGIILVGYWLSRLYKIAYTGDDNFNASPLPDGSLFYPRIVVEASDASPFCYDSTFSTYKGLYNYNLSLVGSKRNSIDFVKRVFQTDLQNSFGYKVFIEDREFEVLKIEGSKRAAEKLASHGGEPLIKTSPVRMQLQNIPIDKFYKLLIYKLTTLETVYIEKNETGFEGNIDIDLRAVLTDVEDVNLALKKIGFEIVKVKRKFRTLVIRDPDN